MVGLEFWFFKSAAQGISAAAVRALRCCLCCCCPRCRRRYFRRCPHCCLLSAGSWPRSEERGLSCDICARLCATREERDGVSATPPTPADGLAPADVSGLMLLEPLLEPGCVVGLARLALGRARFGLYGGGRERQLVSAGFVARCLACVVLCVAHYVRRRRACTTGIPRSGLCVLHWRLGRGPREPCRVEVERKPGVEVVRVVARDA